MRPMKIKANAHLFYQNVSCLLSDLPLFVSWVLWCSFMGTWNRFLIFIVYIKWWRQVLRAGNS